MIPYHFHIQAGSSYLREFVYLDSNNDVFDLTGYAAKLQIRETATSATVALEIIPPITIPTGVVTVTFTPTQTAAMISGYVYAIELTKATTTFRLSEGKIIVSAEVVR